MDDILATENDESQSTDMKLLNMEITDIRMLHLFLGIELLKELVGAIMAHRKLTLDFIK